MRILYAARLVAVLSLLAASLHALDARYERDAAGRVVAAGLRASWITDADLAALQKLPHLRKLDLSYTRVSDLGMERLKPLENITDLNLRYAEQVTDEGIAHLRGWKKLERIDARGAKITDNGLEHLSHVKSLVSIDAGFAEITNTGLDHLAALPNLRRIAIGGNKLSDAGLHFLRQMPQVTHLDLSGSQRTDSGLWFIAITDAGLDPVAALPNLEELNLGGTRVTDSGVGKIAKIATLRSLDLSRTQVTARGIERLKDLPNLTHLNLWKAAKLTDDALPHLLSMRKLEWVDAAESGLSAAAQEKLKKR